MTIIRMGQGWGGLRHLVKKGMRRILEKGGKLVDCSGSRTGYVGWCTVINMWRGSEQGRREVLELFNGA